MKLILLPLLMVLMLQSADIDKRFFSTDTKNIFLEEAKQKTKTNTNKELAFLESTLLSNIEEIDSKEITIKYEKIIFEENISINISAIEQGMDQIILAKAEEEESEKKISQARMKLNYIKTQIQEITLKQKDQLLSYQLQYSLYQLIINRETSRKALLNNFTKQSTEYIQKAITRLNTEPYKKMLKEYDDIKTIVHNMEQKKIALSTNLERELLVEANNTDNLMLEKEQISKEMYEAYEQKFKILLNIALIELALDQKEFFYKSLKTISNLIELIDSEKSHNAFNYYQLIKEFGKVHFGTTTVAVMASQESLIDSVTYISDLLFKPLFVFNEKAVSSADILKIFIIIIVGFFAASFYRRRILNWSSNWVSATPMTAKLTANFGFYLIVLITFFIAISSVGIDLTSISMLASALAIGIGFGLQTVVSNMVAGIIMMFERSIRIGDFVEINDVLKGTVTDMRIRSTVIKTFDNIDVVVPNSSFVQNNVVNMTLDDASRRLHIPFSVAYGTDVDLVRHVVRDELEKSDLNYYKGNEEEKKPLVRMVAMGNSSVDYELLVWVLWGDKKKPSALKSDFLILIYKTLYKHNIEIPFPQLDLHVKELASNTD